MVGVLGVVGADVDGAAELRVRIGRLERQNSNICGNEKEND